MNSIKIVLKLYRNFDLKDCLRPNPLSNGRSSRIFGSIRNFQQFFQPDFADFVSIEVVEQNRPRSVETIGGFDFEIASYFGEGVV